MDVPRTPPQRFHLRLWRSQVLDVPVSWNDNPTDGALPITVRSHGQAFEADRNGDAALGLRQEYSKMH